MRLIQHKKEAYWFYRFLSLVYDRWVNPLFWTPPMRTARWSSRELDAPDLELLDVGAGTGFTTEGIVERVAPAGVTMLDQSPHQLARAQRKPALARCAKLLGTPRICRSPPTASTAMSRRARSSTGPSRSGRSGGLPRPRPGGPR